MELKEVNWRLYNLGVAHDMCASVREKWVKPLSLQELIDLWYDNYDFALLHHYPSNDDLKECFDVNLRRKNGILVDDTWSLLNPQQAMILGTSTSNVRFNSYHVGQIWVRDTSHVQIYAKDKASVTVCIMDNAHVYVSATDDAKVLIMKYSKSAAISKAGTNIRTRENYHYLNTFDTQSSSS